MLTCLSMCDWLLEYILNSILFGLENFIVYLCDFNSTTTITGHDDSVMINSAIEEASIENCLLILDTFDSIIRFRLLDNYTCLNENLKQNLGKTLNLIFIKLTELHPLLAIEMAKIIQLLNIGVKK